MIWTGERNRQQGRLVAGLYRAAAGVPCERSAVIAGGLPGADKGTALDRSGVDRARYLTVSIDAVLNQMAGAGLIPESDGLSPLMRAGQVRAEAQARRPPPAGQPGRLIDGRRPDHGATLRRAAQRPGTPPCAGRHRDAASRRRARARPAARPAPVPNAT